MGPHLLDVTRFFFGEAKGLYCRTYKFHKDIKGEDVATVMLDMQGKTTVTIEMGYPSTHYENDMFPETHLFIEGEKGTLELGREYRVRLTTKGGTRVKQWLSPHYDWADPHYDAYHASIVACNRHMLAAMKGLTKCETAGEDNMRTLELVFACYQSAQGGKAVSIGD
jgi:predicted dehydrogenase